MHLLVAVSTVVFLSIWAQGQSHRYSAGSWQWPPLMALSR